jgi:transposase
MALYGGIDLHSTNSWVVVIDEGDRRLVDQRIANDMASCLRLLAPFGEELEAIAVESTYNWYWLVDGLMDHGYAVKLVNTAAVKQYEGLKHSDDPQDAFWLAHLLRLGILPCGYIYPRSQRWLRDLLRQRMALSRERTRHILSLQSLWTRHTGARLSAHELRQQLPELRLNEPYLDVGIGSRRALLAVLDQSIAELEKQVFGALKAGELLGLLKTVSGIGDVLGTTIVLETGEIARFRRVGNYTSYCRLVSTERRSNYKKKGEGNRKCGNKYLSWAFSEAAHFAVRHNPQARRFYDRKRTQRNAMVAIRALAHKLARASYFVMRDRVPFDSTMLFG